MLWFYLAALAAGMWAICVILDKYVISRMAKPEAYAIFGGVLATAIAIAVGFLGLAEIEASRYTAISACCGFIIIPVTILYSKALKKEDASRVIPLLYIQPIFVLALSALVVGEVLSMAQYLGVPLIVAGAVLISVKREAGLLKKIEVLEIMILAVFVLAVLNTIVKWLSLHIGYWTIIFFMEIGAIAASMMLYSEREHREEFTKILYSKHGIVALISFSIGFAAGLINMKALTLGPATLVVSVNAIEPLFVLVYATIISIWFPRILREEVGRKVTGLKLLAIGLILAGVYLVS